MNYQPEQKTGEKVFSPRPGAGRMNRFGLVLFLLFALLALIAPFLPPQGESKIDYLIILTVPIFLGFACLFYRLLKLERAHFLLLIKKQKKNIFSQLKPILLFQGFLTHL